MKTQNLSFKGQARIKLVILIGLAAMLLLAAYSLLKKPALAPVVVSTHTAQVEKQADSQKGSATKIVKVGAKQEGNVPEEEATSPSVRRAQQAPEGKPLQIPKAEGSCLATDPDNVSVTVDEGERIKSTFKLINNGTKPVPVTIYKSELGQSKEEAEAEMERLLSYKNSADSENKGKNDAIQASVFAGWPWLMLSPQYLTLEPGEAKEIQLTVDARTLESGKDYTVYLYAVGTEVDNSLLIPVAVLPKAAPKISLIKIEVDDGFSADTQGNKDNVANPNETVAVIATLENKGGASAEHLSIGVSTIDTTTSILGDNPIQVPYLGPHSLLPVRIIVKLSTDAHPMYPPALYLNIADGQGRRWQESFYAGEPGKFQYPTGLKTEKEEVPDEKNN